MLIIIKMQNEELNTLSVVYESHLIFRYKLRVMPDWKAVRSVFVNILIESIQKLYQI